MYTTANLLDAIVRRSFSPANQRTFQTSEILALADEVTQTIILPSILSVQEEFFVTYKDYPITAGQDAYDLPSRAIGMAAREVQYINGDSVYNMVRTELDRTDSYGISSGPGSFYLRGNQVVLYPTPTATQGTLRIYYFLRPGDLVEGSYTTAVSTIDTTTNTVVLGSVPVGWTQDMYYDFSKKDGAQEYRQGGSSILCSSVSGTSFTFASLPTGLVTGDIVSLEGQSSLVQLPPDYRAVLATLTAAEIVGSQNQAGADKLLQKGLAMLGAAQELITPRVSGEDRVIVPDWY